LSTPPETGFEAGVVAGVSAGGAEFEFEAGGLALLAGGDELAMGLGGAGVG
jgi:hypothetical protein